MTQEPLVITAGSFAPRRLVAAAAGIVALGLALAGCSAPTEDTGSSEGGTALVAEAQAAVDALEAPVEFVPAGPAIDVGDALAGKTIYTIVSGESAAFVQEFIAGIQDAAAVLGANVEVQDSAYDSTKASELIDKAVASGAGVIVTQSVDSSAVAAAISGAKAAGIPVIEATSRDAGAPTQELLDLGVAAISSFPYTAAGEQMAQFAVANNDGNVNALIYSVPGVIVSERMVTGFTDELARLCPDCTATVVDAPAADWESSLASLTTSNLQTNPNINVLVPVFDAMVGLIEPAIASSGITGVSIVTYNATAPALGLLAEGNLVAGDVGGSPYWLGWATVDQAARLLTGNDPVADVNVPHRIFTANNIGDIDLSASQQSWYGSFDISSEYSALWGK